MRAFFGFITLLINFCVFLCVKSLKYKAASISELAFITKEGKQLWESFSNNVNLPQYGPCWKGAISDLQLGCKFLSENIQSELALRFTDCFLQMSGYEPMVCNTSKDVCLKNLSDRAFNTYTEFYTHTQSICYFLQSQVWHEEAQKTIDRLSDTSVLVTAQLEEAGYVQRKILNQQKESLLLQHYLVDNGKIIAAALELSEKKIIRIMKDFENSAVEQKKVLFELFEKLSILRSWVVGEMSWINSVLFYMAAMVIGYLFTSISYTYRARIYILILLTVNYIVERFVYFYSSDQVPNENSAENVYSWIWLIRKVFISISVISLIYSVAIYCDYNVMNHKLLLEIKNQNINILRFFETGFINKCQNVNIDHMYNNMYSPNQFRKVDENISLTHITGRSNVPKNHTVSALINHPKSNKNYTYEQNNITIDDIDNVSVKSFKSEASVVSVKNITPYNLRSCKNKN